MTSLPKIAAAILGICLATTLAPAADGWERYFAWWPVEVDAYCVSEIQNGKMRYLKWGWVERRWDSWTDEDGGNRPDWEGWRYRLVRPPGS